MSRVTFKTEDDKLIVADTDKDICLYYAPRNPPNTGLTYTRGTDYFAYKSKNGKLYFYVRHWSMWQNEETIYKLIPENEAKSDLQLLVGREWGLEDSEIEKCLQIWPDFLDETA